MIHRPEEGKQEELVAVAGSAVGIPAAGCSLPAGLGNQVVADHMLLAGSSYSGCK